MIFIEAPEKKMHHFIHYTLHDLLCKYWLLDDTY